MKLEQLQLQNNNRFLLEYYDNDEFIQTYFQYPFEQQSFTKRLVDLKGHTIKRKELTNIIASFMEPFGISEKSWKHLKELENDAVVIIGGQQAGLLTGPLYSIHKAITVILMAKQQRKLLGVPVVPVFWIAGEDHDLDEINHTFTETSGMIQKHIYTVPYMKKTMASQTTIDQSAVSHFVDEVFRQFGETSYTNDLLETVKTALEKSHTFTDFFARLMNDLFQNEGLLMIDAAYEPLRIYEKKYFQNIVENSETIANAVFQKENQLHKENFSKPVDVTNDAAHLFYIHKGERVLLKRVGQNFVNESASIQFSKDELLRIVSEAPEKLSNNVITRPLMQEMVFPVLSFVGGPGELAYWGLLKEAFHCLKLKMPILAPRLSFTLVNKQTDKQLKDDHLTIDDVVAGKVNELREQFIASIGDEDTKAVIEETKAFINSQYEIIQRLAHEKGHLTSPLIEKNQSIHLKQLDFLQQKMQESILIQHDVRLKHFSNMEGQLLPNGGLQERVYNPYMYLNQYGPNLIKDLLALPLELNGKHNIVYL